MNANTLMSRLRSRGFHPRCPRLCPDDVHRGDGPGALPRFRSRVEENADSVTLELVRPTRLPAPQPGEFMMMYAFGVGEGAISVSGSAVRVRRSDPHHSLRMAP